MKPQVHSPFLLFQFNDLLLIPCALPPLLWLHARLGLRPRYQPPAFTEIAWHLVIWSILFEAAGPHLMPWTTGDIKDVAAYVAGGVLAALWWNRKQMVVPAT